MKFLAVWVMLAISCLAVWVSVIYWLWTSAGCSSVTPC